MIKRLVLVFLVTCCIGSFALADAPDLSTPKSATVAFAKALQTGDADTAKAAALQTPENLALVDTLAKLTSAGNKLREAAKAKFGEAGAKVGGGKDPSTVDVAKEIEACDIKETGDTATITNPKEPDKGTYTLNKSAGQWHIDVASTLKSQPQAAAMLQRPAFVKAITQAMEEVTTDTNAGKFATADAANQALFTKLMTAMSSMRNPTSGAASAPATQPGM